MDIDLRLPSQDHDKEEEEEEQNGIINMLDNEEKIHGDDGMHGMLVIEEKMHAEDRGDMNTPVGTMIDFKEDVNLEPLAGMEFESHGEAYAFYQEYARSMGFNTAIQNSRRSKTSREFIDAKFACSRYGTKREYEKSANRPRSRQGNKQDPENATGRRACAKTDCKASMHVKRRPDGKWIIHRFEKEHNHELLPAQAVSEQTRRMYAAMARQFAEYKNVVGLKSDTKVLFDKGRNSAMEGGDINVLLEFFIQMQNLNSNFFYAVDVGEDQRVKNLFWVDAKARHDYVNFSDVVSFDTTYVRNKYKMPLALFVGVNQHFQFMLLGCALVSDESASTFSWVMRTWLKAMGGQAPKTVITDHDLVLKSVISEALPLSLHYFCLWHVLGKVSDTLNHVIKQNEKFMPKFEKCLNRSWTDEEFEKRWRKLVDKFDLREVELVHSLYEDRVKWAPTFIRDVVLAGMSTVQRSESVNSFFDKYVHKKTTVQEFVKQYESILQDRYEEEAKADSDTWNKQPALRSPSPFEKHLAGLYTHAVFKKFQSEVVGATACGPKREKQDEIVLTYRVQDFEKTQEFIVTLDEMKSEISCICHLFEYKGYLCRHALIVLQICAVSSIPPQYILKRWTKDAKSKYSMTDGSEDVQSRFQRYNELCHRAMKLSEEGSLSQESYSFALRALDDAFGSCVTFNNTNKNMLEAGTSSASGLLCIEDDNQSRSMSKTNKKNEFFLKSLTLEDVPNHGKVHFVCNSWVYPSFRYKSDRIFFANQPYLPSETPELLRKYRENELVTLRGDGTGKREAWDRIYDYDVYNDLGNPDQGKENVRTTLGGSADYPYPRRGRTGRPPTRTDPKSESRIPLILSLDIYVPRDERFGHLKMSDFLTYALKSIVQFILPELHALFDGTPNEFDSFEDVLRLYEGGIKLPQGPLFKALTDAIPLEMIRELLRTDGEGILRFPTPLVIKDSKTAWRTDEEFAREMLAGVNPVIISRLEEFPPKSKLDPELYGNQNSTITAEHIEGKLDGLTIDEAINSNKLFILNHHDVLIPYLRRINTTTTKTYASRTLLFLQDNGSLKPLAIELSLPHPDGDQSGVTSKVYTPSDQGVEGSIWQLAKAYVAVNDSGVHQLISHWLNTHAVIEPFVIATNRQLSVLHPIHKLLYPHFRDTMNINAMARQILINAGGVLESTVFPSKFAMEMSAVIYKDWVFPDQALPADLVKRGVAVEDSSSPHGVRLLIDDYPYAVDGLEIWSAIKSWVTDYCSFYYGSNEEILKDDELQAWWKEVREVGHGDKKNEPWWPEMESPQELIDSCTTIIWIASALHAAVNFGQYPYAGYLPNRPTVSRKFMPEPGTPEYEELKKNPDKAFLKTITAQLQTLLGVSLIEILSRHTTDEIYLGQRESPEWTKDKEPLTAFERFGNKLTDIEKQIMQRNGNNLLTNRTGPVNAPYTLLFPTSEGGLTGKGIPNSVSI